MRTAGLNDLWFRKRVREAHEAAAQGRQSTAIELLYDLVERCRSASAKGLSTWHEIQALWLLGVELESVECYGDAARAYTRIVALRRTALREASNGLWSALAAAAICEFRGGNRRAGRRLATEVLRDGPKHVPTKELQLLRAEIGKAESRSRSRRNKKKPRGA
jgi:hypothetical protein